MKKMISETRNYFTVLQCANQTKGDICRAERRVVEKPNQLSS